MNYILKVEVFNCFVVSASFCTCPKTEARLNMTMGYLSPARRVGLSVLFACICVCGALYEAVIVSVLAALKQSDNPGAVNPRTAAQAVSAHPDSTQEHTLA